MAGIVCPHCTITVEDKYSDANLLSDKYFKWIARRRVCPECERLFVELISYKLLLNELGEVDSMEGSPSSIRLVLPKARSRIPLGDEVPDDLIELYNEACLVLSDSARASAALSRRCLQQLLHNYVGIRGNNLSEEIQTMLDSGKLPTHIHKAIDAIRVIGNFASHPAKSERTGEILDVEPGEAEWNLEVLESLFDFCFVRPALLDKKRADMDAKLEEANRKPMK